MPADPRLYKLMPGLSPEAIDNIDAMVATAEREAVNMGCHKPGEAYSVVWARLERLFSLIEKDGIDAEHLIQARAGAALVAYHLRMSNRMETAIAEGRAENEWMAEFNRWLFVVESLVGFAVHSSLKTLGEKEA